MLNIMHLAVQMGMLVHQMDVKTAYGGSLIYLMTCTRPDLCSVVIVSIATSVITSEITVWDG